MCAICNKFKTKYLNLEQINALPDKIKNSVYNSTFTNTIIRNNKILHIIHFIGVMAIRISALTTANSTTVSANKL